ncbi:TPA: hypothetical protein DCY65_00050 [Candidatus Acetothermia bacterium]|nr:hypothetical protein [Candidatus Acetothermia bacterium]HAZ29955.1 hypothetical protein [Candidatus Acetothermia bacterium]
MNKGELVDRIAQRTGLTKKDARKALDATIDIATDTIAAGEEVLLTGFGKFEVRTRKRSQRINPQTQRRIMVPEKVVPAFKAGKSLKTLVAKKLKVVDERGQLKVKKA